MYTQKQLVGGISDELEERFLQTLKRLRVGKKSRLRKSIKLSSTENRILIKYLLYGQFVDMGVGKGKSFSKNSSRAAQKLLGKSRPRKAKKWYSKNFRWAQLRIAERLLEDKTDATLEEIYKAIPKTIEMYG